MDLACARLVVRIYCFLLHLPSNITADVRFGLAVAGECLRRSDARLDLAQSRVGDE